MWRFESINMTIASKKGLRYDIHISLNAFGVVYDRQLCCATVCSNILLIEFTSSQHFGTVIVSFEQYVIALSRSLYPHIIKSTSNEKRSSVLSIYGVILICISEIKFETQSPMWYSDSFFGVSFRCQVNELPISTNESVPNQSIQFYLAIRINLYFVHLASLFQRPISF